jgi:predicted homoserine dehydrogenase-like protein
MKRQVRIGLIGAGFIGRSHGLAVRAVNGVFPECPINAVPHILAEEACPSGRWVDGPEEAPSRERTSA